MAKRKIKEKDLEKLKKNIIVNSDNRNKFLSRIPVIDNSPETIPFKRIIHNKELYWVLGIMASLVVVFLISLSYFKSLNKFDYEGLTFTKEKFGEIPIFHYSYTAKISKITGFVTTERDRKVELYLRGDPRKNEVPVQGEINILSNSRDVFISISDDEIAKCDYSIIAVSSFSSLMAQNGIKTRVGTSSEKISERDKLEHITCVNKPNNPVIWMRTSDKTKITKLSENCYVIEVNNCESLPAMEKLMVQTILNAKEKNKNI